MPALDVIIVEKAEALGFIAVGFNRPGRPPHFDHLTAWLAAGKNAGMAWLARNLDVREDPSKMLDNCLTVISLAFPYPSGKPRTKDGFYVARYAAPADQDYHSRLRSLCRKLIALIEEAYPGAKSRVCVDSAPVMERSLAAAAGLGFIGKNNLLIIPGHGSFFYLAEIFTTAPIPFGKPRPVHGQCGLCYLCVESCPTGALEGPFLIDAARCLSYLTLEYRGTISDDFSKKMGKGFLGCDLCQEVCPFNSKRARSKVVLPSTEEFLEMDGPVFQEHFGETALARPGLDRLKRNIHAARKDR